MKLEDLINGQAPGAYPRGTRVVKTWCEPGDGHQAGAKATVVGSVRHKDRLGYFVVWDDMPGAVVVVVAKKIGLAP